MRKPKTAPAKAFADAVLSFAEIIYCFRNYMTNNNNRSTFRFSEKYFMLRVLLCDQKYQKSSKTFPLRNFPILSHLPKRAQRLGSVSAQTSCTPATPFICEKYLMLHVLLHDQKYQKSSKRFPLRNLPDSSRFAKARTIYTLLCEHIE